MPVRIVTHENLKLTISEWAARSNQSPATLRARLNAGWPIETALKAPLHACGRKHAAATEKQAMREFDKLARDIDRALQEFRSRLESLLSDHTPGVVESLSKSPDDRSSRTAQDCV